MPRPSESAARAASARVRRLQQRLPELSVPALLRIRDELDPILMRERVRVADVDTVLRAADDG